MARLYRAALFGLLALLATSRAGQAEEINLLFNLIGSPGTAFMVNALEPWAAKVNKEGAGIIHLDVREGMSLANFENIYDRVRDDATFREVRAHTGERAAAINAAYERARLNTRVRATRPS